MTRVKISGHRGSPEEVPENTLSSFRKAVEIGVDIIETDVRLSRDGAVVVAHDPDFSRLGGPSKAIRDCTRRELEGFRLHNGPDGPERPLFMDEALAVFPDTYFNVDLKDSSLALVRAWKSLLETSGAGHRCRTASFSNRVIRYFRRISPLQPVGVPRGAVIFLLFLRVLGTSRRPDTTEGVLQLPEKAGPFRIVSPRSIKLWHRYGWRIEVWTIDETEDMERLIRWGVDGIITNRPSVLKNILAGKP